MSEIKITKKRLKELEDIENKMLCLEGAGIDNWDGYNFALDEYNKEIEREKQMEETLDEIACVVLQGAYEPSERGGGYTTTDEARDEALKILSDYVKRLGERK